MTRRKLLLAASLLIAMIAVACRGGAGTGAEVSIPVLTPTTVPQRCLNASYPPDAPAFGDDAAIDYTLTDSGLGIFDRTVGDGRTPTVASLVTVHYTGFLEDGCIFDSSRIRGEPAKFVLAGLIPGMREGIGTMQVGGSRRIRIPPEIGYGGNAIPGLIPANSTVIFEVELMAVLNPEDVSGTTTPTTEKGAAGGG